VGGVVTVAAGLAISKLMARGKFGEGAGSTIYCRQMETCFQIGEM